MEQDYRPSKDLRDSMVVVSSTTTALGTNLTLVDTALTQADIYWVNMAVVILSGTSIGQLRRISAFTALTDTITVDTAFAGVIAAGTKYNIVAQYAPVTGGGDATAANQVLILADTAAIMAATDIGVRQVFEKSITAAANVGVAQTIGTVTDQACIIESIIVYADTGQTANLTTCAVTGAAGSVTFIPTSIATQANLATADNQVSSGIISVRLAATKTIVITPVGTGATALDLTVIVTYYSSSANGGTIS